MLAQENLFNLESDQQCYHCHNPLDSDRFSRDSKSFCCQGCLSVYSILKGRGLGRFYEIKKATGVYPEASPAQEVSHSYNYCNDELFEKDYLQRIQDDKKVARFYLEGIHCLACLWLIEKLPEYSQGVLRAQLNIETQVVSIVLKKEQKVGEIALMLASFGLKPHPLKLGEHAQERATQEERKEFLRIGVAGAAMMNIMLYSIAMYAGAPSSFTGPFNYLIALFSLPVMLFSAQPFYLSAWHAIKNKKMNLDFPIAFALIYGSVRGFMEIALGRDGHYFDTLTVLVFLLLLSRYVVKKWGQKGLALNSLATFLGQEAVQVKTPQGWSERHPDYLQKGDWVLIKKNQILPADGIIKEAQQVVSLQTAMLTGEPLPIVKKIGEKVLAGTQSVGADFIFEVQQLKDQTEMGRVLHSLQFESSKASVFSTLADKWASRLVLIIFSLCALLLLYFGLEGDLLEGEKRALSLIIITCPCALALATPLALARSLSLANKLGIVLKNEQLLERIAQVKSIFLDKTGTLTKGEFNYLFHHFLKPDFSEELKSAYLHLVYSMEADSNHPLALCLKKHLAPQFDKALVVQDLTEEIGLGIRASYLDKKYEIKSSQQKHENAKTLGLYEDGEEILWFALGDEIRPQVAQILKKWIGMNKNVAILSGDDSGRVADCAQSLGLDPNKSKGELLPSDKAEIVSQSRPCLMVGDGANDALALQRADVGVAVKGSMQLSLKSCDVYLSKPGLIPLDQLFILSQSSVALIKRNLKFSFFYNLIGITLAASGHIDPLAAAVFMPLSSLTVLVSTIIANQPMRDLHHNAAGQGQGKESKWIS